MSFLGNYEATKSGIALCAHDLIFIHLCRVLGLNDCEAEIEEAGQEPQCPIQRFARLPLWQYRAHAILLTSKVVHR